MPDPTPTAVVVHETDAQRLDREHEQLYHELRSLITGGQVLFAFLLGVAFTERFERLSGSDQRVYMVVVICAALSLVLLLAPTAFHRVRFRKSDKDVMVRLANGEAIAAMVLISISIAGSLYLVGTIALGSGWAVSAGIAVMAASIVTWWVIPLLRHARSPAGPPAGPPDRPV